MIRAGPKSTQFWRWPGYIIMPYLNTFPNITPQTGPVSLCLIVQKCVKPIEHGQNLIISEGGKDYSVLSEYHRYVWSYFIQSFAISSELQNISSMRHLNPSASRWIYFMSVIWMGTGSNNGPLSLTSCSRHCDGCIYEPCLGNFRDCLFSHDVHIVDGLRFQQQNEWVTKEIKYRTWDRIKHKSPLSLISIT